MCAGGLTHLIQNKNIRPSLAPNHRVPNDNTSPHIKDSVYSIFACADHTPISRGVPLSKLCPQALTLLYTLGIVQSEVLSGNTIGAKRPSAPELNSLPLHTWDEPTCQAEFIPLVYLT